MRIKILPKAGLLEPALYFSCDNHRVVSRGIISTVAFWSEGGGKLAERDVVLPPAHYSAWCELTEDDPDDPFFLAAHMETLGLTAAPLPPPPPPPVPETDEERIAREAAEAVAAAAQKEQDIADLKLRIEDLTAQLAVLTG